MQLFGDNTNIEGVDSLNACYGGTNAIINTVAWIESTAWDGRDAIVVAADIAVYAKGPARPTGGVGAVAILMGPNAPIAIEAGLRGSYMKHAYDFFKPDHTTEYPIVDGHYSISCYTQSIDACYDAYLKRQATLAESASCSTQAGTADAAKTPLDQFDYMAFHAPTCKLVCKSYARILYNDYKSNPTHPAFTNVPGDIGDLSYDESVDNKLIEKTFMGLTRERFEERVRPSLTMATMCGNSYTASVWGGLASLLANVDSADLQGKKIGVFSYGGGLAASLLSFRISGDTRVVQQTLNLHARLAERTTMTPEVYDQVSTKQAPSSCSPL
jgi:hydroxymethylglutaryl-CoA synthase